MTDQKLVELMNEFSDENYEVYRDWVIHEENQKQFFLKNVGALPKGQPLTPFAVFEEQWRRLQTS